MGDTPNEKMSRVRNLIRFPATGDPRIRFVTKLRFVCGWLLAVGAFCFVLTHYGLFAPSAIQRTVQYALAGARQHEGDITNIEFENDIFSDGALFESGLAYADSDALYLSRPGSMTTFQVTIGYSNPVVESCQTNVLVYDRRCCLFHQGRGAVQIQLVRAVYRLGRPLPRRENGRRARLRAAGCIAYQPCPLL